MSDVRGYRSCSLQEQHGDSEFVPEHLALVDGDRLVAAAQHHVIRFYRYDDLTHARRLKCIAEWQTRRHVRHLSAGDRTLIATLDDGSLWEAELSGHEVRDRQLPDFGGEVRGVVTARDRILLVIDTGDSTGGQFAEVESRTGRALRQARLPLANVTSVAALDPQLPGSVLVVDARHGAHVVRFRPDRDGDELELTAIDPQLRVTAAIAVSDRWIVAARKGGEIMHARYAPSLGGRADPTADACRRIRELLRRCGCRCEGEADPESEPCACDDRPDRPGGPDKPGPGDVIEDDEPCEERRRAQLGWTVGMFRAAGNQVVAVAERRDRLAVLDEQLNVVFERYLGPRRALLAIGSPSTDRMVSMRRGKLELEAWSLGDYAQALRGVEPQIRRPRPVASDLAEPAQFYGVPTNPGSANPHLRVAVFTVTEPGQTFADPNQAKMQSQLEPNVYGIARDYYGENSFGTVTPEFSVFGVHIGNPRTPLVLPRAIASYFYDDFKPGGVRAVMPGNWGSPLRLDGTESLTLHTDPAVGTGKDYVIPFAALWTTRTHNAYPVVTNFAGTETLQLVVEDQTGVTRTLNLSFAPLSLSHAQGDDQVAFLNAIGQHVTNAIRAAETAAGAPTILQDVVFRRIRTSDDDTQFGRLQGELSVAPSASATQKGRVTITAPAGAPAPLLALGLTGTGARSGVLTSRTAIVDYLRECLDAALFDAGEGAGLSDPQLSSTVDATEDVPAQTVRVEVSLTPEKGGAGAEISVVSSSGLAGSGWTAATPVTGSTSTANNRNTMRDHVALANDVFTAALDHLRAAGPWDANAVRSQFAGFDAMMIGFVGACPTSVPAADRWNSVDPVDFARLRMFVRYHQATDQRNPNPVDPPVTMATNLLIGQRFNQFDPGVMSHEIGHGLGLPDLYFATGFRDDVQYVDRWCQMAGGNSRFNHFCAWSKWSVGWIVESPDPALNRVVDVPMPSPSGVTTTEAWLVPVEYWDNTIRAEVQAAVGSGLPIAQMMKVHLGSDGGIVDLVELRARGHTYSQQLPPTPAVVVTNVLQPGTDVRWAVNGLYRRSVHLLNNGNELTAVGDTWDFASGQEFPLKGCRARIVDLQTIRGGTVPICRLRVEREAAEFIDLYFQDNIPSWRSPDVWVDWRGDNPDPAVPRVYPEGTPTDQGEVVRFPGSGTEPHFVVARPHNAGNVRAEDVKVRWFICDPAGAGDRGRWVQRDTKTISRIDGNTSAIVPFDWAVDPSTNGHQCLRAEIIDWTIPSGVDPATGDTVALSSDDVRLQNNMAQKNVDEFEATT